MKNHIKKFVRSVFFNSVDGDLFQYIYLWFIDFIILMVVYFPALTLRFSPDSYLQIFKINDGTLSSGRLVAYLIDKFLRLFSNPILQQQYYFWMYIALLTSSLIVLVNTFNLLYKFQDTFNLFIINLIFASGFANTIIQEFAAFPENYVIFGIGMLFCTISVRYFVQMLVFNKLKIKYFIVSAAALFASLQCYQIYITVWCTLVLIFLLLKNKVLFSKSFFNQSIKAFIVFFINIGLILLISKILMKIGIMSGNRNITTHLISKNSITIRNSIFLWLRNPVNYLVGIVLYAIIAWLILDFILNTKKIQQYFTIIIPFTLSGILITLGFHLFMSDIWLVPRVLIGLGFTMMGLMLVIYLHLKERFRCFLALTVGITLMLNVYYMQGAIINEYALNRIDQNNSQEIMGYIKDYELDTGIEISHIGFCNDDNPAWDYYNNIKYNYGDVMSRVFMVEWSRIPIINYYGQRKFTSVEVPDYIYNKYFKNKDWNYFNAKEQLVFEGNTLYICNY